MLTHIVCFKYKPEIAEAQRAEHRARLEGLSRLAGVVDLKVGADVVRSPRSYDTGLIVIFTDRAALEAYARGRRSTCRWRSSAPPSASTSSPSTSSSGTRSGPMRSV